MCVPHVTSNASYLQAASAASDACAATYLTCAVVCRRQSIPQTLRAD